jgi:hypothetical protein
MPPNQETAMRDGKSPKKLSAPELEAIYTTTNFSFVQHDTLLVMSVDEALLMGYFLSQMMFYKKTQQMRRVKNKKGEWFFATIKSIHKHLHFHPEKQKRLIRRLKNRGFISVIRLKDGDSQPKRYFQICLDVMHAAIMEKKEVHPWEWDEPE